MERQQTKGSTEGCSFFWWNNLVVQRRVWIGDPEKLLGLIRILSCCVRTHPVFVRLLRRPGTWRTDDLRALGKPSSDRNATRKITKTPLSRPLWDPKLKKHQIITASPQKERFFLLTQSKRNQPPTPKHRLACFGLWIFCPAILGQGGMRLQRRYLQILRLEEGSWDLLGSVLRLVGGFRFCFFFLERFLGFWECKSGVGSGLEGGEKGHLMFGELAGKMETPNLWWIRFDWFWDLKNSVAPQTPNGIIYKHDFEKMQCDIRFVFWFCLGFGGWFCLGQSKTSSVKAPWQAALEQCNMSTTRPTQSFGFAFLNCLWFAFCECLLSHGYIKSSSKSLKESTFVDLAQQVVDKLIVEAWWFGSGLDF